MNDAGHPTQPAAEALVRAHTVVARTPLVPELALHLITEACPLWRASEAEAAAQGVVEPYWAFCWPGGQALARHLLDHPHLVRGKTVLDFGSGCAAEALAALRSGAKAALAADIDPLAAAAARLNAQLNAIANLETTAQDLLAAAEQPGPGPRSFDVVLAGDVFYDKDLAARALTWLRALARRGALVLLGDPSRGFLDTSALTRVATYRAGADGDVSGALLKDTAVYRVPG